jgi:hypothetical protein
VKLFQIEEPDGSPADNEMPGVAIGLDISTALAEVAFAVGGNAVVLTDREGFEHELPVPRPASKIEAWQALFEGARMRAERALARPVTHAVLAVAGDFDRAKLAAAAAAAGLELLAVLPRGNPALPAADSPALAAAILAEDTGPKGS